MRVSEYYQLGRTQPELDFVDVDVYGDSRLFIDPRALRLLPSEWGRECVSLVQNFFREVLRHIREGNPRGAQALLATLREPNETHFGLSKQRASGRAVGREKAQLLGEALARSEAARSGLLEDLEDTILMVEGVAADLVSDMTTNIIRGPLIRYTQDMCNYYGIPMDGTIPSGPLWDPAERHWYDGDVNLPWTEYGPLLLVPKAIARTRMDYDPDEYFRYYILPHLQQKELSVNSELVQLLKNGSRRVTKKSLIEKYGRGKAAIVRETRAYPELLDLYRIDKRREPQPPLSHLQLAEHQATEPPDWNALLQAVLTIPPGRDHFSEYERAIEGLLTALFYPALTHPELQTEIHEGRKRIDITYTNIATDGFFYWLALHYTAPNILIECKNYAGEVSNPELDQLSGRFSPSRGQFGILVCRGFDDKE